MKTAFYAASAAVFFGALPAAAQDSVSLTGGLPGDGVSPYDDSSATNGSEQRNRFVVDMAPFTSSWGNEFQIAPISKSSRVSSSFFGSLFSAQGVSRGIATGVNESGSFDLWSTAGGGVSNDGQANDPSATTQVTIPTSSASRLGAAFAEFATGDGGANYNGVISNTVYFDPTAPERLYVERVVAAANGEADDVDVAQFGFGAVLDNGAVVFRADDFNLGGGPSSNTPISGNNIFLVDAASRNGNSLNVISGNQAVGFDGGATESLIVGSGQTFIVPNAAYVSGIPSYIGTNFDSQIASGPSFGFAFPVPFPLDGAPDDRGNLSRLDQNFDVNNDGTPSEEGLVSLLTFNSSFVATNILLLELEDTLDIGIATVVPNGFRTLTLPQATIQDNNDGFVPLAPGGLLNDFANFESQTPFRGGTGQVSMNRDLEGNLIVAATVDQGSNAADAQNIENYIAVARVAPDGTEEWTIAAWVVNGDGKQVLQGPGGAVEGRLIDFQTDTGMAGKSMSSPMVDAAGNIYFWGSFEREATGTTVTGLHRAVYDAASFSYELELLFTLGEVFTSQNTGLDYQIQFLGLNDSNSIGSSAPWSQNITETGVSGNKFFGFSTDDTIHLGGLVLGVEVVYDADMDGDFVDPTGSSEDPMSLDESYNSLILISSASSFVEQQDLGSASGNSSLRCYGEGLAAGDESVIRLVDAPASALCFLAVSNAGQPDLPIFGGNFVSGFGLLPFAPLSFNTDANGVLEIPLFPGGATADLVIQAATFESLMGGMLNFDISNAVLLQYGV